MDVLYHLGQGFAIVLTPQNITMLFAGLLIGNAVGAIPGLTPAAGAALVLPMTYFLPVHTAVFMLAAIYYGSMYAGSTTAILLNIPGEPAATMTAYEGYKLRLKGRGPAALAASAMSSFIGGTIAVVALMLLSVPLARFGLRFGPADTFSLIVMSFTMVGSLSGSPVRGLAMAALGVCLATVGDTPIVAGTRLTFGLHALDDGFGIVPVAIGLFAIPEVLQAIERRSQLMLKKGMIKFRELVPTKDEREGTPLALATGTLVWFLGGILPGAGATVSTFLTYGFQRRISRHPERFGTGSMEAVVAVESANNAASTGALVPMLSLGIPGSATAAVILGALTLHGVQPGPLLIQISTGRVLGVGFQHVPRERGPAGASCSVDWLLDHPFPLAAAARDHGERFGCLGSGRLCGPEYRRRCFRDDWFRRAWVRNEQAQLPDCTTDLGVDSDAEHGDSIDAGSQYLSWGLEHLRDRSSQPGFAPDRWGIGGVAAWFAGEACSLRPEFVATCSQGRVTLNERRSGKQSLPKWGPTITRRFYRTDHLDPC